MNSRSNFYVTFSVWLIILPMLGIPNIWKVYLTTFSGFFLFLITVAPAAVRYLEMSQKVNQKKKTRSKKAESTSRVNTKGDSIDVYVASSPILKNDRSDHNGDPEII